MKKHGTFADNNHIYLVDLMFMYIKHKKPLYTTINIKSLISQLKDKTWDCTINDKTTRCSPINVINNKDKYVNHYNRIIKANLDYPIIMNKNGIIIDGVHRLSKAYLNNNDIINAYIFNNALMEQFIISTKTGKKWKESDWDYYESLTIKEIRKLYNSRFNNIIYKPNVKLPNDHGTDGSYMKWKKENNKNGKATNYSN